MKTFGPLGILIVLLLARVPAVGSEEVPPDAVQQKVRAQDIGVNTDIVGLLGRPLGEMLTVTATYDPAEHPNRAQDWKRNLHVIRVTRINGRDLPAPVAIVPRLVSGQDADFP